MEPVLNSDLLPKKEVYNRKEDPFLIKQDIKHELCFFIMGLGNNMPYNIVMSSSSNLQKFFGISDKYFSLYSSSLVLFSTIVRLINSRFLVRIHHKIRIQFVFLVNIIGTLLIVCAIHLNESLLSFLGTTVIGIGCALGDSTLLGFLKGFNPDITVGYTSGLGFSGLTGSLLYLLLIQVIDDQLIFMIINLFTVIYLVCFIFLLKLKVQTDAHINEMNVKHGLIAKTGLLSKITFNELEHLIEDKETVNNDYLTFSNLWEVLRNIYFYTTNLCLIYLCQYASTTYLAKMIQNKFPLKSSNFFIKNIYEIFQNVYKLGVFLARSSLSLIKCFNIVFLTLVEISLLGFWIYLTVSSNKNYFLMFFIVFLIGLIGGFSFVLVIYSFYIDKKITKNSKEISTTLNGIFIDTTIMLNGFFGYFMGFK